MAKKKTADKAPVDPTPGMFDPYVTFGLEAEAKSAAEGGKPAPDDRDDRIEALTQQIAGLTKGFETLQSTQMALMTVPRASEPAVAAVAAPATPGAGKMSVEGLPDPVVEPEKYATALNERIQRSISEGMASLAGSHDAAQDDRRKLHDRTEVLWADFAKAYPDYAEEEQRVAIAAEQVARRAGQRGMDLNQYMFNMSPQFFQDVDKEMKALWGEPKVAGEDEGDTGKAADAPRHPTAAQAAEAADRTGGIVVGGPAAGGETKTKEAAEEAADTGIIGDVIEFQKKSGFYA